MKRADNLFQDLISYENLSKAIDEVNRTHHWHKKHKPNKITAWVEETKAERIVELRNIILQGFEPKKPRMVKRYDTSAQKWRIISEPAQWPDQYVHHALIQILQPVFMRGMDPYCCGSIKGRGTKQARSSVQRWTRKDPKGTKYEGMGDIYHFYQSLTPEVVMSRMRELIKDARVLDLISRVIKNGITIGAYTSQWFANTVLQPLDRLIREHPATKHYERYMDNLTIFGSNKRQMRDLLRKIEEWLNARGLRLKGDWQVFRVIRKENKKPLNPPRNGVTRPKGRTPDAVGYRYGRDFTLPRKRNLLRLKRQLARYRKRLRKGKRIFAGMAQGLISRIGQLKHCNNVNLYRQLFQGERIVRDLKNIVRENSRKENLTWSMYLALRAAQKSSKPKADSIPT